MTSPTRQEIIEARLARIWAEQVQQYDWAEQVQQYDAEHERKGRRYSSDPMRAAANFILAHTAPPTMAEVEWDDDKHFLAEAELKGYGPAIMLWEATPGYISVIREGRVWPAYHEELTPTGKRYTLTEVQE